MKKILFVCDGENFSQGAFNFIKTHHETEPVFVKGMFFSPIDFEKLIAISYIPTSEPYVKLKEEEKAVVQHSKDQFVRACEKSKIMFSSNDQMEEWNKYIFVRESRFADLVVISEDLFCANFLTEQPNYFMQEALRGSECPVIVIPEKWVAPEKIVVAYDGKKESIYALKQFTYLFPQFADLPIEFIYAKKDESEHIPEEALLKEYAAHHYNKVQAVRLHFDPKKYFAEWLEDRKNLLLITGSYSRSALSNLWSKSFADQIIEKQISPIFIAHYS